MPTRHERPPSPLRTTRSLLERLVRDILHNDFFKFNVHSRLQGCRLPAQQALTPKTGASSTNFSPLRTTGSLLECIVRDILHNNFIKFNVHIDSKVEYPSGCGFAVSNSYLCPPARSLCALGSLPPRTTGSQLQCIVRHILHNNFIQFNVHSRLQG